MYKYSYKAEKQRENKSDFLRKSCLEQPTQYREWVLHSSTRPGGVVNTKITWVIKFSVLWQAGVIAVNGKSDLQGKLANAGTIAHDFTIQFTHCKGSYRSHACQLILSDRWDGFPH